MFCINSVILLWIIVSNICIVIIASCFACLEKNVNILAIVIVKSSIALLIWLTFGEIKFNKHAFYVKTVVHGRVKF